MTLVANAVRSEVNLDCALMRAVAPVFESRATALSESGCSLVVTDREARVLWRSSAAAELERRLEDARVEPGCCLEEAAVGTNCPGMSFAGAPVRDRVRGRLLGTVNLASLHSDRHPLLAAWLLEIAANVERRIRNQGSLRERQLLDAFLEAKGQSRGPLVCLDEQTILCNSAAARILDQADQARLWEQARRVIEANDAEVAELALDSGRRVTAHCKPIRDGRVAIGAKFELRIREPAGRLPAAPAIEPLDGLAGHGPAWRQLGLELAEAWSSGEGILLRGEPGSGKLASARAMFRGERIDVFDAALHAVEDGDWLAGLGRRLREDRGVVVVQHLEALEGSAARTVASLLERAGVNGPRIVGTLNAAGAPRPEGLPLEGFGFLVDVPALRERLEDLAELLDALTATLAGPGERCSWTPDAVQTLSRLPLPRNVRSLEFVVKQVIAAGAPTYVDVHRLPAQVRAAAARRPLSRLEQVEAAAIATALRQSGGNKVEAASSLGIARSTLYRRMRSLGIDLSESNF